VASHNAFYTVRDTLSSTNEAEPPMDWAAARHLLETGEVCAVPAGG
jgi:hypothetical protein